MIKKCIDCGAVVVSRREITKRCMMCSIKKRSTGRKLPNCIVCGKKLSAVKNKTNKCGDCSGRSHIPWNKGKKIGAPWNKGISKFKSKEEYRIHKNKLRRKRRLTEPIQEKMADRIRTLIRNQIRRHTTRKKNTKTEILLGCNPNFFIDYLEQRFEPGMCWGNYGIKKGTWNIDHIKPVSLFDLTKVSEQKKAFHFTNCQPMWTTQNIKKGNKLMQTKLDL